MKLKYYWINILFVMLTFQASYGQQSYIIEKDSTLTYGAVLLTGDLKSNCKFIRVQEKEEVVKYYPDQIIEYRLKNGVVFVRKEISIGDTNKLVFLQRLEEGSINLYFYVERGIKLYFLEVEGRLIEITKDTDFRKTISYHTKDYEWKANQNRLVRCSRKSFAKFLSMYNSKKNLPLPFIRFGLSAGYEMTYPGVPSDSYLGQQGEIKWAPSSSLSVGLFGDLPIEMTYLSLNVGMNFSKSRFYLNYRKPDSEIDVVINTTSAMLPIMFRYTIPDLDWRTFFNAGGVYSFQIQNDGNIYESTEINNVISIDEISQTSLISKNMLGYILGLGWQHNLDYRKTAAFELRYNHLFGSGNALNSYHFQLLTSFTF